MVTSNLHAVSSSCGCAFWWLEIMILRKRKLHRGSVSIGAFPTPTHTLAYDVHAVYLCCCDVLNDRTLQTVRAPSDTG
jgi:hypothetical protein